MKTTVQRELLHTQEVNRVLKSRLKDLNKEVSNLKKEAVSADREITELEDYIELMEGKKSFSRFIYLTAITILTVVTLNLLFG